MEDGDRTVEGHHQGVTMCRMDIRPTGLLALPRRVIHRLMRRRVGMRGCRGGVNHPMVLMKENLSTGSDPECWAREGKDRGG